MTILFTCPSSHRWTRAWPTGWRKGKFCCFFFFLLLKRKWFSQPIIVSAVALGQILSPLLVCTWCVNNLSWDQSAEQSLMYKYLYCISSFGSWHMRCELSGAKTAVMVKVKQNHEKLLLVIILGVKSGCRVKWCNYCKEPHFCVLFILTTALIFHSAKVRFSDQYQNCEVLKSGTLV